MTAHLGIEARAIAEQLGVGTAPQPSVDRVVERLTRLVDTARREGAEGRIVLRAEPMTVEPVIVNPVPGLDAVLLVDGEYEVVIVGTPDDLREVADAVVALVDDGATS